MKIKHLIFLVTVYDQSPRCKWYALPTTICNPVQLFCRIPKQSLRGNLKWLLGFRSSPWVIHSFIKNWDWWTIWLRELKSSITWVLCLKCSLFTRTQETNTETVQFTQRRKFRAIYFGIDWFSGTNLVHWLNFKALISTVSASVLVLQLTFLYGLQWSTIVPMHRLVKCRTIVAEHGSVEAEQLPGQDLGSAVAIGVTEQ